MLAAEAGQIVSIDQSASRAAPARSSEAQNRFLRRGRNAMASRPRKPKDRVAPRGAQHAQSGQKKIVEHELPAEHAAQPLRAQRESSSSGFARSPHWRSPFGVARDLKLW